MDESHVVLTGANCQLNCESDPNQSLDLLHKIFGLFTLTSNVVSETKFSIFQTCEKLFFNWANYLDVAIPACFVDNKAAFGCAIYSHKHLSSPACDCSVFIYPCMIRLL